MNNSKQLFTLLIMLCLPLRLVIEKEGNGDTTPTSFIYSLSRCTFDIKPLEHFFFSILAPY